MATLDPFEWPDAGADYHGTYSVTVRELVESGFDVFGDEGWSTIDWPTSDDAESWLAQTPERVQSKILRYYWNAEIDPRVPARWRYELTTTAILQAPKYKTLWEQEAQGLNPLAAEDVYGKNRRVYSDFPATQLNVETSDYASTADDFESETVSIGDVQSKMRGMRNYLDTDTMFVREFERHFTQVLTFTLGGM